MTGKRATLSEFGVLKGGRNDLTLARRDQRVNPIYSVAEAADYLSIPKNTLYAWTLGRRKANSTDSYPPVLSSVDQHLHRLSFYDLVEAHILRAFIEQKIPLTQMKRGLAFLRQQHPTNPRPLLTYDFVTYGKDLLVKGMLGSKKKDKEALVNASRHGQLEITPVIEEYLRLIGRDTSKMPNTLFPKDGHRIVSITSGVVSGRPVIEGTRIPTSVIAQRFNAGEEVKAIAKDYQLSKEKIEAAIKYEKAA
jgi:uncharacterized protein (DUF433 family)